MKIHLITQGDSLGLTTMGTACGLEGDDIPYGESGYFGESDTLRGLRLFLLRKVTCRKCKATKDFREQWAEAFPDEPHPFVTAAKAAIVTKKIRADIRKARADDAIEFLLGLPWKERNAAIETLTKEHRALLLKDR